MMFGLFPAWGIYIMFQKAFKYMSYIHTFQSDVSLGMELLGHWGHMFSYNR